MSYTLKNIRHFWILVIIIMSSCQPKEKDGHAHAPDGSHPNEGDEVPTVVATVWTGKTELFVEYPALVVGKTSSFAAHFTILDKHKPVLEGSVTVSLIKGKKGVRQKVEAPSSPGIFKPSIQPKEAGVYQLTFDLNTPTISDKIMLNDIQVYASVEQAKEALGDSEAGSAISFLKEQAWKIEFQTESVLEKDVYETIPTSGIWMAAPDDYQTIVAKSSGSVDFKTKNLTIGMQVKKGQVLMNISSNEFTSNNLSAEIRKAKASFKQAKAAYNRKQELYTSKIIAKADFELAEEKFRITKANYETVNKGYASGGKSVKAPFDGYVKSISAMNGGFVKEGAALVMIASHQTSLLETQISPSYAKALQNIRDIWYQPKSGIWSSLNQQGGSILSVGKEVDSDKPLLSVLAQVNEAVDMPEGSFTEVQIGIGLPSTSAVVPLSALLEDYGNYSVIVQSSGEGFERRDVKIGNKNGSEVAVLEGLKVGEVIVTKGAYQVKMASMSGAVPAHGHDH